MWILFAFLNPVLHSFSNVLDNYLVNRIFEHKIALVFYITLTNAMFLPVLFLFTGLPGLPSGQPLLIFIGLAFINVLYLYPYYKALENNDTSSVVALFSLGQLFVPILAFYMVNEVLSLTQYIGIGFILLGSIFLNVTHGFFAKINSSFWWMLLCTLILSFEYVLYKLAFFSVDWITGFSWPIILSVVFIVPLLLFGSSRRIVVAGWPTFVKKFHFVALEESATFSGIAAGTYAVSLAPTSLVKAITATEPIFVLLYAWLFGRFYPQIFKEQVDRRSIYKKSFLFGVIFFGVVLAVGGH